MYLIVIAWLYVTLMMAVAEATNTTGTVLGAIVTFVLYGLLPMGIVVYIMGTPSRKRAIKQREQAEQAAWETEQVSLRAAQGQPPGAEPASAPPDAGSEAPATAQDGGVAPVRKEP